jgi:hypothetical protein
MINDHRPWGDSAKLRDWLDERDALDRLVAAVRARREPGSCAAWLARRDLIGCLMMLNIA